MQFDQQRCELRLSEKSDWGLFESSARRLVSDFGASVTQKPDGIDQRYWDMQIGEVAITLYLERYLGLSLIPATGVENNPNASRTIEKFSEHYA